MLHAPVVRLLWGSVATLMLATPIWVLAADEAQPPDAAGEQSGTPNPSGPGWLNLAALPFIPVPEIDVDPDGGTTIGILPVWLKTDDQQHIDRIIAPDLLYNPYFGMGFHGRLFEYPSTDEQWSMVGGADQRVQREFDAEYQKGRLREERWSFNGSLIYDRNGTPRFYGVGNNSPAFAQTDYTEAQELAQLQVGLNLDPQWQVLYTMRIRSVDVLPGTLAKIASLQTRFGDILGVGTTNEQLNRFSIIYDSRDDFTAPRRGMQWVAYGGVASRRLLDDSLYSEAGIDGRDFWPLSSDMVFATHMALRYLPSGHQIPFWALSSIGGGESDIGGPQLLRGFGAGRFYDRNSFSASAELRRTVISFNALSHVDIELTPFVDVGDVFARTTSFPIQQLHKVGGVGFRGIARPSVVGYVDIGYGSEGVAAFTGINYPF